MTYEKTMIIHWKTIMIADVFDGIFHNEMIDMETEITISRLCIAKICSFLLLIANILHVGIVFDRFPA